MKCFKKIASLSAVFVMCLLFSITSKADAGLTEVIGGTTMETATPISFGVDYVSAKDGEDAYYKFTTPGKKAYYFLYVKNINISYHTYEYFNIKIKNAYEEIIGKIGYAVARPNEDATLEVVLDPNTTYYIHANAVNSGNFRMCLYYNEDKIGDNMETSTRVALSRNVTGTIDGTGDEDWYWFQTGNYRDYILNFKSLSNGGYTKAYVYNQYGEVLGEDGVSSSMYGGRDIYLNNLTPNTRYYIRIFGQSEYGYKYLFNVSPNRISIQDTTVSYNTTYTYNGKNIQPGIIVTYNGKTLSRGSDYTVSYSNNKKPGRAKIIIRGMNGYTGTVTKSFDILPKKQTIKKLVNTSGRKLKVSYTKDITATGYEIQYSPYKTFFYDTQTVKVKGKNNSAKTITKLKKNQTYYVRVRTYVKSGSVTVAGKWSTAKKIKMKK